jgi:hypothetical protein
MNESKARKLLTQASLSQQMSELLFEVKRVREEQLGSASSIALAGMDSSGVTGSSCLGNHSGPQLLPSVALSNSSCGRSHNEGDVRAAACCESAAAADSIHAAVSATVVDPCRIMELENALHEDKVGMHVHAAGCSKDEVGVAEALLDLVTNHA